MKSIICPFCDINLKTYANVKHHIQDHIHNHGNYGTFEFRCKQYNGKSTECPHPPFNCVRAYLSHLIFKHRIEK
uniref:C2H2-type domain-containing protein n=1 Tax=Parastrongyloides trichosuri TaxID=131310 RepID=A0A0N4ZPR9_PARTI